jgi:DUF438 domain-containing protein
MKFLTKLSNQLKQKEMNANTQRSNEPLYKVLNEERTQGEWDIIEEENTVSKYRMYSTKDGANILWIDSDEEEIEKEKANINYTALAVNNLNQLAKFAEWIVKEIETTPDELTDALLGLIKLKANEALNKIS